MEILDSEWAVICDALNQNDKLMGSRVGAVLSANDDVIEVIGYGVYEGSQMGSPLGLPNPRIKLDNGEIVWGCECWWGSEDEIKAKVQHYLDHGRRVIEIDIRKEREGAGIAATGETVGCKHPSAMDISSDGDEWDGVSRFSCPDCGQTWKEELPQ